MAPQKIPSDSECRRVRRLWSRLCPSVERVGDVRQALLTPFESRHALWAFGPFLITHGSGLPKVANTKTECGSLEKPADVTADTQNTNLDLRAVQHT